MLVTPTFALPPVYGLPPDWDGVETDDGATVIRCALCAQRVNDAPSDEALLVSAILGEPPVCDAPPPPWDGATHTMLVVSVTEPPADEPEWLTLDPWTLEAVREYDARYA